MRRKPSIRRNRSISSPTKLNSIRGGCAGAADTRVTRPRDAGLKMVALKLAICAPRALQDVLLCAAIYMSLGGAAGIPDEYRKQVIGCGRGVFCWRAPRRKCAARK